MRGAKHGLVTHQQRRVHFRIAVLLGVQIEHEGHQGALHARQSALQHDKARARHARGGLEIHQAQRLADFEMFFRREARGKGGRRAEAACLDIAMLVTALGHVGARRVGDFEQRLVQLGDGSLFLRFHLAHAGFQLCDLGLQRVGAGTILGGHGLADLLRGRIAALLGDLQAGDGGLADIVEREQLVGQRLKATPRAPCVEDSRILADPFDVVHEEPLKTITGCTGATPAR